MEKKVYDVIIVGSGIVGLFIAYSLSKFDLDILVLEKEPEVGMGVSKGHASVIHVVQLPFNSLKSRLGRKGNKMYDKVCKELNVRLRRLNTLILAISPLQYLLIPIAYLYLKMKLGNEFPVKAVFSRKGILRIERNISEKVLGGIIIGGYGVIDSFDLIYSLYRFASKNGVEFRFNSEVQQIKLEDDNVSVFTDKDKFTGRYLINAAGLQGARLACMIGDDVKYEYGKGAMIIFSDEVSNNILTVLSLKNDPRTKGGSITPTVDGKSLWGPNLVEVKSATEVSVTEEDIKRIMDKFMPLVKEKPRKLVKGYAGVRPLTPENDFIIKFSSRSRRIINVIGICSPGLTAAPAIAEEVLEMLRQTGLNIKEKEVIYPEKPVYDIENIRRHILMGEYLLCPCSIVSKGDVSKAVEDGAVTLQGLSFRTKLGFDECLVTPGLWRALKHMADELGTTPDKITLKGEGSWIVKKY